MDSFFVTCTVMDDAMAPTVGVDTKVAKVDDNVSGNGANKHATPAQTVARIEESHHLAARRQGTDIIIILHLLVPKI